MDRLWIEKLAIQELCSRYCQTIDAQDSEGRARCFLPDGVFEFDDHVVRGYVALRLRPTMLPAASSRIEWSAYSRRESRARLVKASGSCATNAAAAMSASW